MHYLQYAVGLGQSCWPSCFGSEIWGQTEVTQTKTVQMNQQGAPVKSDFHNHLLAMQMLIIQFYFYLSADKLCK